MKETKYALPAQDCDVCGDLFQPKYKTTSGVCPRCWKKYKEEPLMQFNTESTRKDAFVDRRHFGIGMARTIAFLHSEEDDYSEDGTA